MTLSASIFDWFQTHDHSAMRLDSDLALGLDVSAARAGDGDAYARIVRRYQPMMARRMTRFTRSAADVEELVHDVFVEAYFGLQRYRGDAPLEHWLQRIATRIGYRYWKRQARERGKTVEVDANVTAKPDRKEEDVEPLLIAVAALPPRDRLVITLLYLEGRSVAEAATLSGWSQTLVKVQAFRARAKLKKLLTANVEDRS